MNETIDQGLSLLQKFLANADAVSIVLTLLGSWGFAQWAKFPIQRFTVGVWHAWTTRTACSIAAAVIASWTWPNAMKAAWVTTLAFGSPWIFHWGLRAVYWKFPHLRDVVSAQRKAKKQDAPRSDNP